MRAPGSGSRPSTGSSSRAAATFASTASRGSARPSRCTFPATDDPILPFVSPIAVSSIEGTETILLVEDNRPLRVLAAAILESYGYNVVAAANGPEALELAAGDGAPRIDLLLTDLVMPVLNGWEVAEKLADTIPGLRVLFTSGYPSGTIVRHGVGETHDEFIQKPYLPAELAHKVREILTNPG